MKIKSIRVNWDIYINSKYMHSVISLVEAKVENRAIVSYIINQSRANLSFLFPLKVILHPKQTHVIVVAPLKRLGETYCKSRALISTVVLEYRIANRESDQTVLRGVSGRIVCRMKRHFNQDGYQPRTTDLTTKN